MVTQSKSDGKNEVKSVGTAFQIIEELRDRESATVAEITSELDLSKSAVYKHLQTLESHRYVVKEGGVYRLGLRFLNLGHSVLKKQELYEVVKPELDSLAEETGETANLLVEERGRGVFLYRADGDQAVNLDTFVGKEVYLQTTALGKALMAHLPPSYIAKIIEEHGLPQVTEKTITDRGELNAELEEIRDQGYAFDDEERLKGLRCVAVPILESEGSAVRAISVSGPKSRMSKQRCHKELPKLLKNTKNIIELNIEHQ